MLFNKYAWYKAFGCQKDYEDIDADETDALLMIHAIMKDREIEMMEKEQDARRRN